MKLFLTLFLLSSSALVLSACGGGHDRGVAVDDSDVDTAINACVPGMPIYLPDNETVEPIVDPAPVDVNYETFNDGVGSPYCEGCNSFGSGGSKNTGLLASKVLKAQIAAKAASVASQFEMSVPAATRLVALSVQVKNMRQQRQLTQADRDAIAASAFRVAGVTTNQVNQALKASLAAGNQRAINEVMETAAQNLGMPSGATFRDKIMPLFMGQSN